MNIHNQELRMPRLKVAERRLRVGRRRDLTPFGRNQLSEKRQCVLIVVDEHDAGKRHGAP